MSETALITGASGGLGEHFARLCAADGMNVILIARSKDSLEALAQELSDAHGIKATVIAQDLSEPVAVSNIAKELTKKKLTVDFLINNAGFGQYGLFADSDTDKLKRMMEVNMIALTMLTREIVPGMIKRKRGRILNVASTAAFPAGPLMDVYYASKAYVLSFSVALSNELKGTGVTATCLCPGPTKTGFVAHAGLKKSKLFRGLTMLAPDVARIGYSAALKGKHVIVPGFRNRFLIFGTRLVSRPMAAAIARRNQQEV
jgi:short-subunit dehydrogenase